VDRTGGDGLPHLDAAGHVHMVNVAGKTASARRAVAAGTLTARPEALAQVRAGTAAKGDVLAVARVAAIMGAKQTAGLIPLAHPIPLTGVSVDIALGSTTMTVTATVETEAATGVEMEALTAVAAGLLTLYDMLKKVDRGMTIGPIRLLEKSGGRSGSYRREQGADDA
jgi:cyclic pyranopterin phosphate synthase